MVPVVVVVVVVVQLIFINIIKSVKKVDIFLFCKGILKYAYKTA